MKKTKASTGAKKKIAVPVAVLKTPPHAAIFEGLQAGGAQVRSHAGHELKNIQAGIVPNRFSVIATTPVVPTAVINVDYNSDQKAAKISFLVGGHRIAINSMPFCGNPAVTLVDSEVIKKTLQGLADGSIWADECQRAANPPATTAVL